MGDIPPVPLRLVILAPPRAGKTTTVLSTCEAPAFVLNCDGTETALLPARRAGAVFDAQLVTSWESLQKGMAVAKAGKYHTVVLDTLSGLGDLLEAEELKRANNDGRRAYQQYGMKLRSLVRAFWQLPCHAIITSHFVDLGPGVDGDPRAGRGIFPLLAGNARESVAMLCPDVVFLELRRDGSRRFLANPLGVWGAGAKSIAGVDVEIPPNIPALLDFINRGQFPPATQPKESTP